VFNAEQVRTATYHHQMTTPTATPIERDIVIVRGADAGEYLQTQFSQDVLSMVVGQSVWSFLLKPKSEVVALFRVTRSGENEYTLDLDPGWGDVVRQAIDEFLFRMEIEFEQDTWPGIAWRGGVPDSLAGTIQAPIRRGATQGIDEIGPDVRLPDGIDVLTPTELDHIRVASGWPAMGVGIDGSVTPAMTGLVNEAVAFEKGCYTGQEFVARVHYRGTEPPRRLIRIDFDAELSIVPGAVIMVEGEDAGYVTSVAQGVALGYLKRRYETPSRGVVADVAVRLDATPQE